MPCSSARRYAPADLSPPENRSDRRLDIPQAALPLFLHRLPHLVAAGDVIVRQPEGCGHARLNAAACALFIRADVVPDVFGAVAFPPRWRSRSVLRYLAGLWVGQKAVCRGGRGGGGSDCDIRAFRITQVVGRCGVSIRHVPLALLIRAADGGLQRSDPIWGGQWRGGVPLL